MTLEVKTVPVLSPGSAGSNDTVKIGLALYRDGVIQAKSTWDGTHTSGGTSKMDITLIDEGSAADLEDFDASDFTQGVSSGAANHYWASKTVAGATGAQVVFLVFDILWNNNSDTPETLTVSIPYPVRFAA